MDRKNIYALAAAQGMRIIESESCTWAEKRRFFLESAPGHRRVRLKPGEAAKLFLRGAAALRYTCHEDEGAPSFEYVCTDKNFGLASLAPDARRRVRRGLEACEIRPVDCELLRREGRAINCNVFARQGRVERSFLTVETMWDRYMRVCATLPNLEAYGAFVDGRLIGFSFGVFVDDYCYLFHTHAYSDYLKHSPINALTFTVMKSALGREGVNCVSQGLESFRMLPDVERFKFSMGYYKRSLGRRIVLNPLARPFFSGPGSWFFHRVLKRWRPEAVNDFSAFTQAVREGRMLAPSDKTRGRLDVEALPGREDGRFRPPLSGTGEWPNEKLRAGDRVNER